MHERNRALRPEGFIAMRSPILAMVLIALTGAPAFALDGFEKVRCDADIAKALIGQRGSNEPVAKTQARHKQLGLENLGGEEVSSRLFLSSWKICGREFALLQQNKSNRVSDAIEFPAHAKSAPAFGGIQCERDGKPIKDYVTGVMEDPAATAAKLLRVTQAWKVDDKTGKFVKLDVAGLACSREDIITVDGGR
jgi:hypothetical protein